MSTHKTVKFCHMRGFLSLSPQLKYRTILSPQGSLVLPLYNYTFSLDHSCAQASTNLLPLCLEFCFRGSRSVPHFVCHTQNVCNILRFFFFLTPHPFSGLNPSYIDFYCWVIFCIMDIPSLLKHSLTKGHLGSFQWLAIINKAILNIQTRFWCGPKFSFSCNKFLSHVESHVEGHFSF